MAKEKKKALPGWLVGITFGIALLSAVITRLAKRPCKTQE